MMSPRMGTYLSYVAVALVVRDLIGRPWLSQEHYDELVAPWATVFGKVHPGDRVTV